MKPALLLIGATALCSACVADTPGTHPTDMSVQAHETLAKRADVLAKSQEARRDVRDESERTRCGGKPTTEPCWTSSATITPEFSRYHKVAKEHREAAQALRDAEAAACSDISEHDRDVSPFAHDAEVVDARRLVGLEPSGDGTAPLRGASVIVRAVPGLTKEYLERDIGCHMARNASMGFAMPEMAFDPLAVKGATTTVIPIDGGFRIDIVADDPVAIAEIARRADALVASR